MKMIKTKVECPDGKTLRGLLFGNNAAWICRCDELLGNRTADGENIVACEECGAVYEILRAPNSVSGNLHLGSATGIKVKDWPHLGGGGITPPP